MAQDPRALLQKAQKAEAGAGGGFSFFGGKTEKVLSAHATSATAIAKYTSLLILASGRMPPIYTQYAHELVLRSLLAALIIAQQAANSFRLQKAGKEAGQTFEKAASIQTSKLSEPDDAANSLTEASKAYRKTDPEDAARVLSKAIDVSSLRLCERKCRDT